MASRLGPLLCWAIVFADIGTSVYYVPGILYRQVGATAGLFVSLTMIVFVLLALKYAEVSARFPEGGGVVTVASRGINAWAGAIGGMFILVDYFLTSAISSLSGLIYFETVIPRIAPYVLMIAPEYVRYELLNGVKIAHNRMHDIYAQGAEETAREQGARSPSLVPTPPLANPRANSNGAGGARTGRSAPPGASPPDRTHPTDKP
jgi:hypothetical protein